MKNFSLEKLKDLSLDELLDFDLEDLVKFSVEENNYDAFSLIVDKLASDPRFPKYHKHKSSTLSDQVPLISFLQKAIKLFPNNEQYDNIEDLMIDLIQERADYLFNNGKYENCLGVYLLIPSTDIKLINDLLENIYAKEKHIVISPPGGVIECYILESKKYVNHADRIKVLEKALKFFPDVEDILAFYYNSKGYLAELNKDIDQAIEFYCKALEYYSNVVDSYDEDIDAIEECYKWANIYEKNGESKKANKCYLKLIEYYTCKIGTYDNYDEALEIYYKRANIYEKIGELSKAAEDFWICSDYEDARERIRDIPYEERKNIEVQNAILEERNRILSNLSHHIKNMIGTIIDPLENMKNSSKLQPVAIDNAIRGANLVRGLVNAMNQSLKGSILDFQHDIKKADYNNATSLYQMFIDSLKYSISSMFDGKYFEKFMRNFFPNKSIFLDAKNKWNEISQSSDLQAIELFMDTFMLQTEFNFELSKDFVIGNDKGSSLKLLILIQEMVFNAVKYSSFVPKQERFLKIDFNSDADYVSIKVSNKYQPKNKVKSSGLGHEIINNFSKLLETKPLNTMDNEKYSVEIKFKNLWEV